MLSDDKFLIQPVSRAQFGVGSVAKLSKHVAAAGAKRALIVTDHGLVKAGVIALVQQALESGGVQYSLFDGVNANPTTDDVFAGAEALRELLEGPGAGQAKAAVIAVGGGSAMDAAKAISLLAPNGGKITDLVPGCKPAHPGLPLIAVPTTAGTGSETNMFAVVTDPEVGRKILIGHGSVHPQVSVLDPKLTLGVPPKVTATCGMDVLVHAVESYISARPNPFAEAIALRAIAVVATHLPEVYDDGQNLEARSQMLLAAHLAGVAFSSTGLGMCHAMGHPLSARLGVAHGQSLSSIFPAVLEFSLDVAAPRLAQVAIALGVADPGVSTLENAEAAIVAIRGLSSHVGTNLPLSEFGLTEGLIPALVEDAFLDPLMTTTPKRPEPDDVTRIYQSQLG